MAKVIYPSGHGQEQFPSLFWQAQACHGLTLLCSSETLDESTGTKGQGQKE